MHVSPPQKITVMLPTGSLMKLAPYMARKCRVIGQAELCMSGPGLAIPMTMVSRSLWKDVLDFLQCLNSSGKFNRQHDPSIKIIDRFQHNLLR